MFNQLKKAEKECGFEFFVINFYEEDYPSALEMYEVDGVQFEVYTSASNDYCVSVSEYGKEIESYNIGKDANEVFEFIKSYE